MLGRLRVVGVPMLKAERISCSGPKLSDAQTRNFEAIKHKPAFPDAGSTSGWAREAMEWAVAEGLFSGYGATGELRPGAGATRAQVATVLMRFIARMYE